MYCTSQRQGDALELSLHGRWQAATLSDIQAELASVPLRGAIELHVAAADASFDLSGAWLLHNFLTHTAGGIKAGRRGGPADAPDSLLDPDAIAATYLHVIRQPRSAWACEVELRPWVERF